MPWSILASLMAHVIVALVALAVIPNSKKLAPPDDEGITVEMVSGEKADRAVQPPMASERIAPVPVTPAVQPTLQNEAKPLKPPPQAQADEQPARMIAATQLYAAKILAAPKSRKIREGLRKLATEEHMVQLCNIEAMEQVHRSNRSFQPDYLIAYAMSDPKMSATAIAADGGAFRSGKHWYSIRFKCAVTADLTRIVSFAFLVGGEIPRKEWRSHNLAPDDGPDD